LSRSAEFHGCTAASGLKPLAATCQESCSRASFQWISLYCTQQPQRGRFPTMELFQHGAMKDRRWIRVHRRRMWHRGGGLDAHHRHHRTRGHVLQESREERLRLEISIVLLEQLLARSFKLHRHLSPATHSCYHRAGLSTRTCLGRKTKQDQRRHTPGAQDSTRILVERTSREQIGKREHQLEALLLKARDNFGH